jgi:mRNA-degrading endonuclease RelE of RelBE toxin-antitoxin system
MSWQVKIHNDAVRQLDGIPPDRRKRILNDIDELAQDPFRGLVKPLKGAAYKACTAKCQAIILKPIHGERTVEVLSVLPRNERTYG